MEKYVCFMRKEGHRQERGFIADKPLNKYPQDVKHFIVCKIDEEILTEDMILDDTICLKLEELIIKYPNTNKIVIDENGEDVITDVFGYFDANGHSSKEECPTITLEDVTGVKYE